VTVALRNYAYFDSL